MHRIFRVKAYEAEHGPHFNEEHARKAVSKMENEDGTRGPHWSVEEKKEYRNKYKNGWVRFWHFDWKRIRTKKYQIVNSNPIIKVTDTRVIELPKQ